jgi:hypothetical protein
VRLPKIDAGSPRELAGQHTLRSERTHDPLVGLTGRRVRDREELTDRLIGVGHTTATHAKRDQRPSTDAHSQ